MRVVTLIFLAFSSLTGQFRYSVGAGLGGVFPAPDMDGFNSMLADSGLDQVSPLWIPTAFMVSVQAHPSLRVGYVHYSNGLLKNRSSDNWALTITTTGILVETYFTIVRRMEANFGFAPMIARADFSQTEISATTSPFQLPTSTSAGIQHGAMAYASWVGGRFYVNPFLAVELTAGYLNLTFKGDGWKSDGQDTTITGKIDLSRPLVRFALVVGW